MASFAVFDFRTLIREIGIKWFPIKVQNAAVVAHNGEYMLRLRSGRVAKVRAHIQLEHMRCVHAEIPSTPTRCRFVCVLCYL